MTLRHGRGPTGAGRRATYLPSSADTPPATVVGRGRLINLEAYAVPFALAMAAVDSLIRDTEDLVGEPPC